MCSKACEKDMTFHLKIATASTLMSRDILAKEAIYNFYIKIT